MNNLDAGKCLKIEDTQATIGDAMLQCSVENGRLIPLASCEHTKAILEELYVLTKKTNRTYYIGDFAFATSNQESSYRNWEENHVINS